MVVHVDRRCDSFVQHGLLRKILAILANNAEFTILRVDIDCKRFGINLKS